MSTLKRWLPPLLVVLLLIVLALSVGFWLPPILAFVGANSELIQAVEAGVQLVLWLGAAAVAAFWYLRGRRSVPPAPSVNTGGGAYVAGDVQAGEDFVGRDQFVIKGGGNVVVTGDLAGRDLNLVIAQSVQDLLRALHQPPSKETLQKATEAYYHALLDRHRYLSLQVGLADRVALRLPLLDLYVPLKARLELPEDRTRERQARLAGRELSAEEMGGLAGRLGEPQPVLDLLQQNSGLIILGDPGAGKTTFLKYLALRLAVGEGDALGLGERLPLLLPLSAYANALGGRDVRLDDFVVDYLHASGADLPIRDMLAAAMDAGKALILLDGLDEVKNLALRHVVVQRVADFYSFHRSAGNKFVLTSRVVGYRDVRPTVEGLVECTLVDFDDDDIAAFVNRWTAALERQAQGDTGAARADAARERRDLLEAVHRNPSVRRLAANPLLLTILALMKRQGVTLPERRVELYDQCVRTLLSTWNRVRSLGRPLARDLDVVQTVSILAPLALWMHRTSPGVGLVKHDDLSRQLEAIYTKRGEADPQAAAYQFLGDVEDYAGLLLERGPGAYGFIHLTFEEYLAAVAIAQEGQGDCRFMLNQLAGHVGDPAWREVSLLTIGYLGIIQRLDRVAGELAEALAEKKPGPPGEAVVLAGEAVVDIWPAGVPARSKEQVVNALVPTTQGAEIPAILRRRAGLALGHLGWRPADLDRFVAVEPGQFPYGDDKRPRVISNRYWIGKYPVTNAQYERFAKDGGYERREFWGEAGWAWRNGADADLAAIADKELRDAYARWLADRSKEKRGCPYWWNDPDYNNPIFPVVGVSWFEAEAYAKWLNAQRENVDLGEPPPERYVVRLPTEEECERAARGADGREYPWGNEFDAAKVNTEESDPERKYGIGTTAICTYPLGASPVGAWDMSGNVWEWTLSRWSERDPFRVVRGGSWLYGIQRYARCAYRPRYIPDGFLTVIGFRVVVSLSVL